MSDFKSLLQQFREALADCEELYVGGGRECAERHPELITDSPSEFVQLMDDLHKGLLVKIYVTIAEADRTWSREEQQLAGHLFQHIWDQRLRGKRLSEAFRQVSRQSLDLKWYSLIRPFDQMAPLRNRIGQLETVVMRVANLVAKADGEVAPQERKHLVDIQHMLDRHLRPIPLDEPGQHETAQTVGAEAIRTMKTEVRDIRAQYDLPDGKKQPEPPQKTREELLQEVQEELDGLVGIANIKQDVRNLINFLKIQQERERAGLPKTSIGLHMVFLGNPGTGKTTVARIVGRVFAALGVLQKGHLIETDRSGLVARFAGQTGPKTHQKIDEALDGILFIDEAYSLVAESGDDAFGNEAVQALLKRAEDDRDRLIVILAGYPEPMDQLLKSNPGLSSRFNRTFTFHDYTAVQLGRIFQLMCRKNHYELPPAARAKLVVGFQWLLDHRDEHFGNGRLVRNSFESAIRHLANRVIEVDTLTKELLTTLHAEDIKMPRVPVAAWASLNDEKQRYLVACPGCDNESRLPQKYLGRRLKCKKCEHRFTADWGQPVAAD